MSPYVIIYACMDLDLPLPPSFDMVFFWQHLSRLIEVGRPDDLAWEHDATEPYVDSGSLLRDEYARHPDDDPDGTLEVLYRELSPDGEGMRMRRTQAMGPRKAYRPVDVYIGATHQGTAGIFYESKPYSTTPKIFALSRPALEEGEAGDRETYAMLDAAGCWAPQWADRTVRFHVSSPVVAWHTNEFVEGTAAEYPALEVVHALALRWGFEVEAQWEARREEPTDLVRARVLAVAARGCMFTMGTGLVLEVLDAVMLDCEGEVAATAPALADMRRVVLPLYRDALRSCRLVEYTGAEPPYGWLYMRMRMAQRRNARRAAMMKLVQPLRGGADRLRHKEVIGRRRHTRGVRQKRLMRVEGLDSVAEREGEGEGEGEEDGMSVEGTEEDAEPRRVVVPADMLEPDSRMVRWRESKLRRARDSVMRRRAAADDSQDYAQRPAVVHVWAVGS